MTDEIIKEVQNIKEHLKEIAPEATNVKIHVNQKVPGLFESIIKIRLPRKKTLLILKRGFNAYSSLLRSHQAVLKVLVQEKVKSKRCRTPVAAI